MKTVIDYLDYQSQKNPGKYAFRDLSSSFTYQQLKNNVDKVASSLIKKDANKEPIAIFIDKSIYTVELMLAIASSDCFYVVLDENSPYERIKKILSSLNPRFLLTDNKNSEKISSLIKNDFPATQILIREELESEVLDEKAVRERKQQIKEDDLLYVLFTSGSTGTPKGVMITHKNVLSYTTWFINSFKINEDNVFGNQTPFYFSMSVTDIYGTLLSGAELDIIPKSYFSFPIQLVNYLNDRHINTIYWVPSVFSIIKYYRLFDYVLPKYLHLVLFAGEVMQLPWLNYFRSKLPNAEYANLFGPTETTDICTYYVVNRDFKDSDVLPIGKTCEGLDVFLLNDQHQRITEPNQKGEMYVSGPFVSEGYYKDKVRTEKTFVLDPSKETSSICYKSGDCCYYNELGELMFASRIDFQIKHLGYRIELGEIESNVLTIEGIMNAVCVYDSLSDRIILFYTGKTKEDVLNKELSSKVPHYMMPTIIKKEALLMTNPNGKIDRKYYQNNLNNLINK